MSNTPYSPTTWTDESPVGAVKYQVIDDTKGHVADSATIAPVSTITPGTPVNATNLNKLEQGLLAVSKSAIRPLAVAGAAKTLATDTITVTPANGEGYYTVDTEGSAAWDALSTINGGADGDIVYLIAANVNHVVILSYVGNISIPSSWQGGLTLSSTIPVGFRYSASASKWVPISIFDPGVELWYNNSGSGVAQGNVVVFDKSGATRFKTSVIQGDKSVLAVVMDTTIPNANWGWIAFSGRRKVLLNAAVTVGQALITSTVSGLAIPNGGAWQDGYIGYVVDATNSPTYCLAEICPNTSRTGGQATFVRSVQWGAAGATNTATVTSGTVQSDGSNRLLLVVATYTGSTYAPGGTCTWNGGQSLTLLASVVTGTGVMCIFYILAPAVTTATVTVTIALSGGATDVACTAMLFNDVNQSTPVSNAGTFAATTNNPSFSGTVTPGDFCVCAFGQSTNYTVSGRGAGQVNLVDYQYTTIQHCVVDKIDPATNNTQAASLTFSGSQKTTGIMAAVHPL